MTIRHVLSYPDKRLRAKARPVEKVGDSIRRLIDDLAETMYAEPGIGLAAPQVGESVRVFVIDLASPKGGELLAFVNPRIIHVEGEIVWKEGCLSFPGISEEVTRAKMLRVEALDRDGRPFALEASELMAVAIQHESDHLDGKLLIDRVSFLKKRMIRREMAKWNAEHGDAAGRRRVEAPGGVHGQPRGGGPVVAAPSPAGRRRRRLRSPTARGRGRRPQRRPWRSPRPSWPAAPPAVEDPHA